MSRVTSAHVLFPAGSQDDFLDAGAGKSDVPPPHKPKMGQKNPHLKLIAVEWVS